MLTPRSGAVAFFAVLIAFAIIDSVWITFVAGPMFRAAVGTIMLDQPYLLAAVPFYLIYAGGIIALAVRPSLNPASPGTAIANGAVLGLTAYATFEFTSLAILKGWTMALVVVDVAWGTLLTALAAYIGHRVGMRGSGAGGSSA